MHGVWTNAPERKGRHLTDIMLTIISLEKYVNIIIFKLAFVVHKIKKITVP